MANFLFPCIALLDELARLFSASQSRDVEGRDGGNRYFATFGSTSQVLQD